AGLNAGPATAALLFGEVADALIAPRRTGRATFGVAGDAAGRQIAAKMFCTNECVVAAFAGAGCFPALADSEGSAGAAQLSRAHTPPSRQRVKARKTRRVEKPDLDLRFCFIEAELGSSGQEPIGWS